MLTLNTHSKENIYPLKERQKNFTLFFTSFLLLALNVFTLLLNFLKVNLLYFYEVCLSFLKFVLFCLNSQSEGEYIYIYFLHSRYNRFRRYNLEIMRVSGDKRVLHCVTNCYNLRIMRVLKKTLINSYPGGVKNDWQMV